MACCTFMIWCSGADAQMGNSYVTADGINRAPAVALHCVGPGNVAAPCGTAGQPLIIAGPNPLATASNQSNQLQYEQAIAAAAGTQQDNPYSGGPGTTIALLKGLIATFGGGVTALPASGTFISRSTSLPAVQSVMIFPANLGRHYIAFQVPSGNSIWLNFLGGVASPNGIDCVQFSAGTFYESGGFVTRGAVSVYTPIAVAISAWEG
jgi:hypothetical protein